MKKFLMYVIIVVTCLFLGFTIYYLTQNNENIYITVSKEESIYKNKGESLWLDNLLVWTKPYKSTTIKVTSADENVVTYDENTKRFDCIGGGFTAVTITPSNTNFGPFVFEIYVGDGTIANPYVIDSAEDLALIGNDPALQFNLTNSYILSKDIDLRSYNNGVWNPLGEFAGNFNGDGHIIYNMNIISGSNAGLFSSLASGAMVENVKFSSAVINGAFDNAGVVAGVNKGTIGKCEVISAKLTNSSSTGNTGAIAGANIYDITSAMINMCSVKAEIISNAQAGGLVGFNKSSIVLNSKAIVNAFEAQSSTAKLGGLVGINESTYNTSEEVYYASAIKNSYAIINKVTGSAIMGGVVAENKEDSYVGQMFYNTYVGCIYALNSGVNMSSVGEGQGLLTADANSNLILKTKQQLLEQASYQGYNFDTVWTIVSSETASINMQGAYETYKIIAIGKEVTPAQMSLKDFLENVKNNLANNVSTYRITENYTLDLEGRAWETIAPNESEPMLASIIVDDGVSCVITNFVLKEGNSSFFGYISGNTIVKGITFKDNIIVESCNASSSGVVATGLLNGATLENITVKNFTTLNSQAQNVGVICGFNKGSIINCSVACDELKPLTIRLSDSLTNVGGIVGTNNGYISNCVVDRVNVCVDISGNRSGSLNLGGIAGTATANISNSKVISFVCDTTASGVVYAGGVVGYLATSNTTIYKCYSLANIKIGISNQSAYLGGITGYLAAGVTIKGCFYNNSELTAYNVGGLVGISYGTVFSSYVGECTLTGCRVGGLIDLTYGRITDCYVLASLKSAAEKSILCGYTVYVGPDCYIEHIFSNATFSGNGKYYAESKSEFRTNKASLWLDSIVNPISFGPVLNNIVIVNNDAWVQVSSIFMTKGNYIPVTLAECNGETGNYSVFKDKASFDTNIWNFDQEAGFPTLKEVAEF